MVSDLASGQPQTTRDFYLLRQYFHLSLKGVFIVKELFEFEVI